MSTGRVRVKRLLATPRSRRPSIGATVLIYHRIGGGGPDELDLPVESFRDQLDVLAEHRVVSLDDAVAAARQGDRSPRVVLTFDDGFRDVYENAWPLLRGRELPFTVYVASGCIGGRMSWAGSTARGTPAPGLTWEQLAEMVGSGLCTIGNHTHRHVRPELLETTELDTCNRVVHEHLGVVPRHFAYTWGVPVPRLARAIGERFDSAATGRVGRAVPGGSLVEMPRVPVRRTDPVEFFEAKLTGRLGAERAYARIVSTAKRVGVRA